MRSEVFAPRGGKRKSKSGNNRVSALKGGEKFMAKKYQKPQPTGREYVDAARAFNEYTTHMLMKLPEKWKEYLLNPLHESADRVESLAIRANRIYLNPDKLEGEALRNAYEQRMELLKELIREMDVFERKLIHLTDHIELMQDESKRMRAILRNMIRRELRMLLKEKKIEVKYEISVKQHINEFEYTTTIGTKSVKLGMTPRNKDRWITLAQNVVNETVKRLRADQAQLAKLVN